MVVQVAKGDDLDLKADLDGGFARVSNTLLEALSCAPLSGAEFRVVMFVIRRTYGWAQKDRPSWNKMDTFTRSEVARATNLPSGTAGAAIATLQKVHVLHALAMANNKRAYGMNTRVDEWGDGTTAWACVQAALKDARDFGLFSPATDDPSAFLALRQDGEADSDTSRLKDESTQIRVEGRIENESRVDSNTSRGSNRIRVDSEGQTPRAPGAPGVPTDIHTDSLTDKYTEESLLKAPPPAGGGPEESDSEPSSQRQTAFGDTAWQAHGLPLPCPKKVVSAARFFVKRHGKRGADLLLASWASTRDGCTVPDGADPEEHIAEKIRSAAQRDFEWDPQKQRAGKGKSPTKYKVGKHTNGRVEL